MNNVVTIQFLGAAGKVYIVHGEPQASDTLQVKLKDVFGWDAEIPDLYDIEELSLDFIQKNEF